MDELVYYLSFPFVQYALIVGVLVALCSALLGVPLVLKRYAYIGDGLSHVAFGAMSIGWVVDLADNMLITMPITISAAIMLLKNNHHQKMSGDSAIALLSVSALSFGYLMMNVFGTSANVASDVCSSLFGATSILTLSSLDVWVSVVMSLVVISLFIIFYHQIFAVTFDETFAEATGVGASKYNLMIAVVTAIVIVLAMNLVGALLVTALIIFPALSAMNLFHQFSKVVICSAVLAIMATIGGIILSILHGTPVGATIVAVHSIVFVLCKCIQRVSGK